MYAARDRHAGWLPRRGFGAFVGGRTVPLLAIFSAFSFAIMMFNVPVPGGTTAHGVGGTLSRSCWGRGRLLSPPPWRSSSRRCSSATAASPRSAPTAQHGRRAADGGLRDVSSARRAQRHPLAAARRRGGDRLLRRHHRRRAAGWHRAGHSAAPLQHERRARLQPYGFGTAIPSMLVAHVFGASFVEAAITALASPTCRSRTRRSCSGEQPRTGPTPQRRRSTPGFPAAGFARVAADDHVHRRADQGQRDLTVGAASTGTR